MDQPQNPIVWDEYLQRAVQQELAHKEENLVPLFDGIPLADLQQYNRASEAAYIPQDETSLRNWNGGWPSWNKYDPEYRSSMPTLLPLGPLTPGLTSFDDNRTINPDSLIKLESEFGSGWSFGFPNTPQDLIVPISPISPSRVSHPTPTPMTESPYDGASREYFDLQGNPSHSSQPRRDSILSSDHAEESIAQGDLDSQGHFNAQILPTQIAPLPHSYENAEAAKKRGSKADIPVPGKRRRSKAASSNKHNQIEKRYRTNLNDKISALRDSVPSLRAMMDIDGEDGKASGGEESDEEGKSAALLAQRRRSIAKAEVLSKAAEYIHDLEKTVAQMEKDKELLQAKIDASEGLRGKKRGK